MANEQLKLNLPAMVAHEGEWEGTYSHLDYVTGKLLDQHYVHTRCEFPDDGPFDYVQHNLLRWDDGRTQNYEFGGKYQDGKVFWDTERFRGYGWETEEGTVMLKLDRLDVANAHYIEMINMAADGQSRARCWQWFIDGTPWKRTLCDERRLR